MSDQLIRWYCIDRLSWQRLPDKSSSSTALDCITMCGVEVWRGGLGGAYLLPTLSFVGASLTPPCFRFHTPLIEPDVRVCRIRLSEKTHAIAVAIACDAVCNF